MKFNPFRFGRSPARTIRKSRSSARSRRSIGGVEPLEQRALLAIDFAAASAVPGDGGYAAVDTNRDHFVTAIDALLVIAELNRTGSGPIAPVASPAAAQAFGAAAASLPDFNPLDVNRDGFLSAMDAMMVVQALDATDIAQIRLEVTDTSNNPITQVTAGGSFKLNAYVFDLRTSGNQGVFAAWSDVTYNGGLASTSGPIDHGTAYTVDASGVSSSGLLDEIGGAFNQLVAPGASERLLWSVPFQAGLTAGTINFVANPAELVNETFGTPDNPTNNPSHNTLLFPSTTAGIADIFYGEASLEIIAGPTLSVDSPASVTEGDVANVPITFTVTLSEQSANTVTVNYTTEGITATDGIDYEHTEGQLTFNPGETSKPIVVNVIGDTLNEATETFRVVLSSPTGGPSLGTEAGTGTILDNDAAVTASISGPTGNITETESSQTANFTVTLSAPSGQTITVNFATVADTALAGSDFTAVPAGLVTFNPGETSKPIPITVLGDNIDEATESFQVQLTGSNVANINTTPAAATILDNDPLPTLSVNSPSVTEPASDTLDMTFTISLSKASGQPITVSYETINGTAVAGATGDYLQVPPTQVTFAAGETSKTVVVKINSDVEPEQPESFTLHVTSVTPTLGPADGTGTILDSVTGKLMRIRLVATDLAGNPITQVEATEPFLIEARVEDLRDDDGEGELDQAGVFAAFLDILYSSTLVSATGPITFDPAFPNDQSGSVATPGIVDEVGGASEESLPENPAGEKKLFTVQVVGLSGGLATFTPDDADLSPQSDVFLYKLDRPLTTDEVLLVGTSITILPPPELSIGPASVTEGDGANTTLSFPVTLSKPSSKTVTVNFTTVAQTATAGADFTSTTGQVTFAPGDTSKSILVTVLGDLLDENDETLLVNLSGETNSTISVNSAVGTILDNDPLPTISIDNAAGVEGATNAVFTVTLSPASGRTVTVNYATVPGTAASPGDFTSTSGQLTFAPGQTSKQITVPIIFDSIAEAVENFTLVLSGQTNAVISGGTGVGSISDLPTSSISGWVYRDLNGNGIREAGEIGLNKILVTLTGTDFQGTPVTRSLETNEDGSYSFTGLFHGTYSIIETQPIALADGEETAGTLGGTEFDNQIFGIAVTLGSHGFEYNFGEGGLNPAFLTDGNFYASSLNGRK